jgi:hypothetical protein
VARTIHAQYKPGDFTPGNTAKAREAITTYQRILDRSSDDDEAYKAVAYLYGALKEDALLRPRRLEEIPRREITGSPVFCRVLPVAVALTTFVHTRF